MCEVSGKECTTLEMHCGRYPTIAVYMYVMRDGIQSCTCTVQGYNETNRYSYTCIAHDAWLAGRAGADERE